MAAAQSNSNAQLIPGAPQSLSMRIGRSAAELAKPCFTAGSSRVARSRATKALGLRKRKAVSPQSPPSPNQESAVNPRTGKVAFGPWLGPYETHTDASSPGPLFLDHQGNTYASLTSPSPPITASLLFQPQHLPPLGSTAAATVGADKTGAAGAAATAAAAAAAADKATQQQLYAMVSKVVQRQASAAAAAAARLHDKPSQWPGHGKPHGTGRCRSTMARAINQPRRS